MKSLLVLASLISVSCGHSPVLLWPAGEFALPEGQSALDMMNIDDFQKLFEGKKIIVFHKKTFNIEEVSYPKKELSYLQGEDALALQGVKSIHRFVGGLTSSANLKLVRLPEGDLDEQQDVLKNAMALNPGFAAVLVGSGSHRSRRAVETDAPACSIGGKDTKCMAYIGAVEKSGGQAGTCTVTCDGENLVITIDGETKISVTKDGKGGGFSLNSDGAYKIDSDTTWAPTDFSYSCAALRLVPTKAADPKKPTITLRRLQVFPGPGEMFPEAYDCATWFTPALWMGTLVALFYIFLLFGAVLYLLDVKTNDRFDDPKGKTITVNVAE